MHYPSGDGFLEDFQTRLLKVPPASFDVECGDHILNPGVPPYVFWEGEPRQAAVLVPIVQGAAEPEVILTLRTTRLSSHGGQIAFPGGKVDPGDPDPMHTAIREAEEEIGLAREYVRPLRSMGPYLTGSGFRVTPVVTIVASGFELKANPDEVDEIFSVPLSFLMDPFNHRIGSRPWNGKERFFYEIPYGERYIWGVTAGIIRAIYETIYGD
ncbi:MAG: CoA pyrophosphatase [Rhodobacteraceae bacterium]|nr:CoA pyrophosphatase [Paracoccaceae bacterium]